MGTAIKHPVPDRVKPSFVIFDIRALWRSVLSSVTVSLKWPDVIKTAGEWHTTFSRRVQRLEVG